MRKARRLVIPILISIPCLFLFAQCHLGSIAPILTGKKIWLSDKPQSVEQEILRQVPIGSSIEAAREVMEQNDFVCRYIEDGTYYYRGTGAEFKNVDFYRCDLNRGWLVEAEIWEISLETKRDKLTQISVSYRDVSL